MIDYSQYKLWEREQIFSYYHKDLPEPKYAILWEDPNDLDLPAKVTIPSKTWLAMAMHGGILPPVEVYWALRADETTPGFQRHHRGSLLHETQPMRALSEEEAMEYLIMKDIPPRVWRDYTGNRTILKIVPRHAIPTDRSYRNAWRITQETENV